jgi:hypothetical protein
VLRLGGRSEDAEPSVREALRHLEEKGNVVGARRARALLGD